MKPSITLEKDELQVSGDINFESVMDLWNQSLPLLKQSNAWQINLAHATASNSAALALFIEWQHYAKQHHKSIIFKNIPQHLQVIAKIAGVASLI